MGVQFRTFIHNDGVGRVFFHSFFYNLKKDGVVEKKIVFFSISKNQSNNKYLRYFIILIAP